MVQKGVMYNKNMHKFPSYVVKSIFKRKKCMMDHFVAI